MILETRLCQNLEDIWCSSDLGKGSNFYLINDSNKSLDDTEKDVRMRGLILLDALA